MQLLSESELSDLVAKVEAGERLTREDGLRLLQSHDIITLGILGDLGRRMRVNDVASYDSTISVRYSEDLSALSAAAGAAAAGGAVSVRLVGGPGAAAGLSGALAALKALRDAVGADVVIEAFSPALVDAIGSHTEVLSALADAGLNVLGHGEPQVGDTSCLQVHRAAHLLGIRSVVAFTYGHGEEPATHVDQLLAIRALQDETGDVLAVLPLPFRGSVAKAQQLTAATGRTVRPATTGDADFRLLAMARVLIDNVTHVAASVPLLGIKFAQASLAFGVDHLVEAGQPPAEMRYLYDQTGRETVVRDALYRVL